MAGAVRIPISFDRAYLPLAVSLRTGPKDAHVTVDGDQVDVQMGWAFCARFKRSQVVRTAIDMSSVISRGAHGRRGRWLVNGAGPPLVEITLDPPARARVALVPIRLRELVVSVEDADELIGALEGR